jgi:hypothetical protein
VETCNWKKKPSLERKENGTFYLIPAWGLKHLFLLLFLVLYSSKKDKKHTDYLYSRYLRCINPRESHIYTANLSSIATAHQA